MSSTFPGELFVARDFDLMKANAEVSVWASLDEDVDDIYYVKYGSVVMYISERTKNMPKHTPECFVLTENGFGWMRRRDLLPLT